jgi:hypothetical protein
MMIAAACEGRSRIEGSCMNSARCDLQGNVDVVLTRSDRWPIPPRCRPSLRALIDFTGNALICREYFEHQNPMRFALLRSNPIRDHIFFYLRKLSRRTS